MFFRRNKKNGGKNGGKNGQNCCGCPFSKVFKIVNLSLLGLLLAVLVIWIVVLTRNDIKEHYYIGKAVKETHEITIGGEGKIIGVPDIAKVRIGFLTEAKEVAAGQKQNTEKVNKIVQALIGLGIEKKDLKTVEYEIRPKYDFIKDKAVLSGYAISQSLEVKIRNLEKIGAVLAKAGELGANQIGQIEFAVENSAEFKKEARRLAIVDAREKAANLSRALGLSFVKIIGFSEDFQGPPRPYPLFAEKALGGAMPEPQIETGTLEFVSRVNIVYEIGN